MRPPAESRSAPAAAERGGGGEGDAARHLDQEVRSAGPDEVDGRGHLGGGHVVEHHHGGSCGDRFLDLLEPVALDLDHAPRPEPAGPGHGLADRHAPEVVVLDEHGLGQAAPVVVAAARPHGRLLEGPQARRRLAGVQHACRRIGHPHRVDERPGEGRHARQVSEEIERGPLGGDDRAQRPLEGRHHVSRADRRPVGPLPTEVHRRVDLGEGLDDAGPTGQHAAFPAHDVDDRPAPGGEQRRAQVPERQDVLGDGPGHGLDHCRTGGVAFRFPVGTLPVSGHGRPRSLDRPDGAAGVGEVRARTVSPAVRTMRQRHVSDSAGWSLRAWAPRLSRRRVAESRTLVRRGDQIGQLTVGAIGRGPVPDGPGQLLDQPTDPGQRVGAAHHPHAVGHRPLKAVAGLGHVGPGPARLPLPGRRRRSVRSGLHPGRRGRLDPAGEHRGQHAGGGRAVSPGEDRFGQAGAEDHALEQRVRGEPVCTVHAGAGDLAGRPEAGEGGRAPEVGQDAAGEVVGGRCDGQPVGRRIEPDGGQRRRDGREAGVEGGQGGGVQPEVLDPLGAHALGHRAADHVPRGELVDEALAPGVPQQGPVAAERLGEQRAGHRRMVERGRVELHELDVGDGDTCPQGHGQPVAGGSGRVGGHREELARPAGREHGVRGPDLDEPPVGAEGAHAPGTCRPRRAGRGRTTPRAPLQPTRVWHRPGRARPRLRSPRPPRGRRGRSSGRPRGPGRGRHRAGGRRPRPSPPARGPATGLRPPGPGPPRCRRARPRRRGCPPGGDRSSPRPRRVPRPRPPWAQRVVDWESSALVRTPTRSTPPPAPVPRPDPPIGAARRTAAERPATPLPRTRTSRTPGGGGDPLTPGSAGRDCR